MKTKFLTISIIAISIFFIACDEDSITEAILGTNTVTVTGSVSNSFDAITVAGLMVADSISIFSILMKSESSSDDYSDIFTLMKVSDVIPPIGEYGVVEFFGSFSGDGFFSTYSVNDSTEYLMTSGIIEITESSTSKVAGSFDVSGILIEYNSTTPKVIAVKGEFSTIPVNLDFEEYY